MCWIFANYILPRYKIVTMPYSSNIFCGHFLETNNFCSLFQISLLGYNKIYVHVGWYTIIYNLLVDIKKIWISARPTIRILSL